MGWQRCRINRSYVLCCLLIQYSYELNEDLYVDGACPSSERESTITNPGFRRTIRQGEGPTNISLIVFFQVHSTRGSSRYLRRCC